MHPDFYPTQSARRKGGTESGFSILIALFIIVVLGALAALVIETSGAGQTAPTLVLLEARAFAAAESGAGWGAYEAVTNHSCPGTTTLPLTANGLSGFSVTVSCSSTAHTEYGATFNVYVIQADASNGTFGQSPDFVQRTIQFTVTDAPQDS
jgi:MSHA biogenesis protein MshP